MEHVPPTRPPTRRAPRFSLQIPLSYRPVGEMAWRDAQTENISRSGVLFRTDRPAPLEMPVEMRMMLPGEIDGGVAATVVCVGRVVRCAPPTERDARPAVAATILRYQLIHAREGDPRRI